MLRAGCRITLLFALLGALLPDGTNATPQPTRILVLFGHDPNAPGVLAFSQELHATVRAQGFTQVEYYNEVLDLDRFGLHERWLPLARYITEKYRGLRVDLIVAEGSMALRFATERLSTVFPGIPVVYGLAFEPVVNFDSLPPHVTGSRLPLPFTATLALARSLQPDAERLVLVGGSAALDSVLFRAAVQTLTPLLNGLDLVVLQDWTYDSLLETLRGLPARTFVILSSFRRDIRGQTFNSGDLIPSVTRAASVPVYGIARNWVGDGVIGGAAMQFAEDGARAGRLVARTLRRTPGEPMPRQEETPAPMVVDWRELKRWSLSESRVPPGAEVLFRTPTMWERHRATILASLALMAAQAILIVLLLVERRRRIRAQQFLQEQAAYEQMMAGLTIDAVRHAPDESPRALEDALARIAMYAEASAAALTVHADVPYQPPIRLFWPGKDAEAERNGSAHSLELSSDPSQRLEISLGAGDTRLGVLELYRSGNAEWSERLQARVQAAAELIAGALARGRAARALEESRGQVAHMGRVATFSQLAAAVSHELRQPLTSIRASAETGVMLLAQPAPDVREAREIFQDIVKDDARATEVIDHIRMLLRNEKPVSAIVDVNGVCRQAVHLLERAADERGVSLDGSLERHLPSVRGDAVQLQQVVLNLTLNALDAAAASERERRVFVGTVARRDQVEVFVRDTGPGLTPHVQQHLFESFFSTKSHGLGMGLAIVRSIVERHRGRVQAENASGGGAVFRVQLPKD